MSAERVAFILRCAECRRVWLPEDDQRWRAYHACNEDLHERPELVFYCPTCAERAFGPDA